MKSVVKELETINFESPKFGNHILNLHPSKNLPSEFEVFQSLIDSIFNRIPHVEGTSNKHYVTIDSKFFPVDSSLRREGLHVDGNMCVDPSFTEKSWGGSTTTWGGSSTWSKSLALKSWGGSSTWGGSRAFGSVYGEEIMENAVERINPLDGKKYFVHIPWVSESGDEVPFGQYISSELGGMLLISDLGGCDAFSGDLELDIRSEGDVEHQRELIEQKLQKHDLKGNTLYFVGSNVPHESKIIKAGNRRTLIRVTLAHDYPNKELVL